jgi:hypothetical protein
MVVCYQGDLAVLLLLPKPSPDPYTTIGLSSVSLPLRLSMQSSVALLALHLVVTDCDPFLILFSARIVTDYFLLSSVHYWCTAGATFRWNNGTRFCRSRRCRY